MRIFLSGRIIEADGVRALDAGVNLIDTADVYTNGGAKAILGKGLKGQRDNVVLASKVRWREYNSRYWREANLDAVAELAEIARQAGKKPVALALQWLAAQEPERVFSIPWFKKLRPQLIEEHAAAFRKVAEQADALRP
jgi:aryl-alcohol dehydrogenase-like predicted oxidoreductase